MWTDARREHCFFIAVGILAIITYASALLALAVDMPKWDDYPDILQFLDRWLNASTPGEKWRVFVSHTNEHILLVNHAIVLGQYYLLGKVNFAGLIFIGNLFYLGSALVLWCHFKNTSQGAFAFAVLMLLGLTFYPHESTLWAMTALSNQAVIFFSLLALWFSTGPRASLPRAMGFTTLAVFSQSNGLFLLPVIGLICYRQQRSWLTAWWIGSLMLMASYAALYNPATRQDDGMSLLSGLSTLPPGQVGMALPAFVAAFGSFFFTTAGHPALVLSVLVGLVVLWLAWKNNSAQTDSFVLAALLFLILTLASIALYRGLLAGPAIVFVSRYKMYALYFLAVAVLLSPGWLHRCRSAVVWRYGTLALALLIFSASFWLNFPAARLTNAHLRQSLEYWVEDGDLRRAQGYFIKDADAYLFAALHKGTWSPEVLLPEERFLRQVSPIAQCPPADGPLAEGQLTLRHINRNAPAIRVEGTDHHFPMRALFLCGSRNSYRVEWPGDAGAGHHYLPAAAIAPDSYRILALGPDETRESPAVLLRKPRTR